jgi:hypothetical protein
MMALPDMPEPRATTIRFADPVYSRLEHAAEQTGLTINAIVTVAALEWLDQHMPERQWTRLEPLPGGFGDVPRSFWRGMFRGGGRASGRPFDRLTGHAKNALSLAHGEATEVHSAVTPELVLLGLELEGGGVAAQAIAASGLTTEDLRVRIDRQVGDVPAAASTRAVKQAIEAAFDEARALGHAYVGTEHLLLGLLRDERFSDIADRLRAETSRLLAEARTAPPPGPSSD